MRLRREIDRLEADVDRASSQRQSLRMELERLATELRLQEVRIRESIAVYALSEVHLLEAQQAVRDLESRQAVLREELRGHLLTLHGFGRQGYLRLLFSVEGTSDVPGAVRQVRYFAQRDAVSLQEFEDLEVELSRERDRLAQEGRRMALLVDQERLRREELEVTRKRHGSLLIDVERRHAQLSERSEKLQERESRLARLLEILVAGESSESTKTSISELRGVLDWPMEGRVVTEFGPRLDRRYRTRIPHNGVAISAARPRTRVEPVYAGKVLFAQDFEGFGLTVVVSHGGGILSLYAGLDSLQVEKGDVVVLQTLLGAVSNELYFEIREQNEAVDPRGWLR